MYIAQVNLISTIIQIICRKFSNCLAKTAERFISESSKKSDIQELVSKCFLNKFKHFEETLSSFMDVNQAKIDSNNNNIDISNSYQDNNNDNNFNNNNNNNNNNFVNIGSGDNNFGGFQVNLNNNMFYKPEEDNELPNESELNQNNQFNNNFDNGNNEPAPNFYPQFQF